MGKRKRLSGYGLSGPDRFVRLPHYMLRSEAWRTMSPNAKAIYIAVAERFNGQNNGEISYSVREAENIGLSKSKAGRAFAELVDRGFLAIARQSSFSLKTKAARLWALTAEQPKEEPTSKAFTRWRAVEQSHQRDREAAAKNKTQSHQRDRQSHQRDREAENETKLPVSVPPAGPSTAETGDSRSHPRDTSNLPYRVHAEADAALADKHAYPDHQKVAAPAQLDAPQSDPELQSEASAKTAEPPTYKQRIGKLRVEIAHKLPRGDKAARRGLAVVAGMEPDQFFDYMGGRLARLPDGVEEKLRTWLADQP